MVKCMNEYVDNSKSSFRLKGQKSSFEFMKVLIYRIFIEIYFSLQHK